MVNAFRSSSKITPRFSTTTNGIFSADRGDGCTQIKYTPALRTTREGRRERDYRRTVERTLTLGVKLRDPLQSKPHRSTRNIIIYW